VGNGGALMKRSPDDIKWQLMALPAGTTWRVSWSQSHIAYD